MVAQVEGAGKMWEREELRSDVRRLDQPDRRVSCKRIRPIEFLASRFQLLRTESLSNLLEFIQNLRKHAQDFAFGDLSVTRKQQQGQL